MRARSSTGWTSGAATYDSGLVAHNLNRPAPRCSALLSGLVLDSHLVPSPVAFSRSQTAHGYRTWPGTASSNARYPQHNHARYDVEGKIAQIDSGAVVMTYDALGRWVEKLSGGNYIQGVYDPRGDELALMFNGTALAEARTPLVDGSAVRYTSGGLDSYFHPDWLGSTRFKSTPGRTVKDDVAFAPFGEQYVTSGPVDSFFTVAPHDMEVDLRDFPARDYHTTQGRWLIPDPAGLDAVDLANPQTLNRYAYVMNDPLANVDPTGMDACFTYYTVNNGDGPTFIASTSCYPTIPAGQDPQQSTYGNRGGSQTGGSPSQPPKMGNLGLTNRQACFGDALVNGTLGFLPGYNATKTVASLVGFNFNPVQFVNGDTGPTTGFSSGTSPFAAGAPTGPQIAAGITSAGAIGADWNYAAAGGAAALNRTTGLISRGSFALQSASRQAKLLQQAASLERLAQVASTAKNLGTIFSLASTAFDLYQCSQKP